VERLIMKIPTMSVGFWRNAFFYLMALTILGVLIWQLSLLEPPEKWCPAKNMSICYTGLLKNLSLRDHVNIGLMAIIGMVIIGMMVVNWGISIRGSAGTDGVHVDVQQDKTTVTTPAGVVSVPTVPTVPNSDTLAGPEKKEPGQGA
jgi:hypothetical protein